MPSRWPRVVLALSLLATAARAAAPASDPFVAVPARMQAFVDQGEIAGAVMLVASQDRVLHLSAIGQSDLASGRKMQTDDLFWIASMTKPMAAACVAALVDEGKLAFDDPVEKYLPEFHAPWVLAEEAAERRVLVAAARPVTLRDLLTHTSGMGEYAVTGPHWTLAEMIAAVAREPLKFQPGSRWSYSTAGIDTLCRVVEVASGVPFAEFMQRRIFGPLGMKDSTFWLTAEQAKRFATNYRRNPESGKLEPVTIHYLYGGAVTDPARPPLGGAGLFATAADVARFYQMMLNGGELGGKRILKPATVAAMTRSQTAGIKAGFLPGSAWGLGLCVVQEPQGVTAMLAPGTFGHGGAHGTQSWADPRRGTVYVLMIQRAGLPNSDGSDLRRVFQEAAMAALSP
ncbi:MAG TPA: serine hydrolase domain-containing protein [Opitutaceae bacterium]|nr:serine hydrolase domain-containing protein [Opitutaceae bacterium]